VTRIVRFEDAGDMVRTVFDDGRVLMTERGAFNWRADGADVSEISSKSEENLLTDMRENPAEDAGKSRTPPRRRFLRKDRHG
jgi:hypothetical protein